MDGDKVIKCPCKSKKDYKYTPGLIDQSIYKIIKIKSKKENDGNTKRKINQEKDHQISALSSMN